MSVGQWSKKTTFILIKADNEFIFETIIYIINIEIGNFKYLLHIRAITEL